MGFRHYLYSIEREKLMTLRARTWSGFGEIWIPDLLDKMVFEYGSHSEMAKIVGLNSKPLFADPETDIFFNENGSALRLVGREAFSITIEKMREAIAEQYEEFSKDGGDKLLFSMRAKIWKDNPPYDLSGGEGISKSSHWEYAVFELTYLFKNFDFVKNSLVFCGY